MKLQSGDFELIKSQEGFLALSKLAESCIKLEEAQHEFEKCLANVRQIKSLLKQ